MLARSASLQLCHQHRCGWGRDRQAGVPFQGWQHQQPSSRASVIIASNDRPFRRGVVEAVLSMRHRHRRRVGGKNKENDHLCFNDVPR